MGDGILSIFPVPTPADRPHQCHQAALAARGVLVGLAALNDRRAEASTSPLDVGIGINVGQLSYGNIGSPGRLDFTVLGGAVNVASRIEGLTKSFGHRVLATAAIAETNPELFEACGLHEVRGLARPIDLFYLSEPGL